MDEDTPQTIALEMLRLITSMQKSQSIHQPKQEYDFLINISGIPVCLTLTMECSTKYLIELSQESNPLTLIESDHALSQSSTTAPNKEAQILPFRKLKDEK